MKICVRGNSHLAKTLARAAELRGFELEPMVADLMLCAQDAYEHSPEGLEDARRWFEGGLLMPGNFPLVLVSQVPPGTTREWAGKHAPRVFYQVDTIIMKMALARACAPEQIIVGCADPSVPLPLAYQEYLLAHDCPVLQMSYESAEMAKCAINYMLAAQVRTARDLHTACEKAGASYEDVRRVLHNDARIGPHAYLRPGRTNQHLDRDITTVCKLARISTPDEIRRQLDLAEANPSEMDELARAGHS